MDVLKFLQSGNVTKNPDYNSNTKKGKLESPTLVNFNPGTTFSDQGRTNLFSRIGEQSYNLNQYNIDKYTPYDVYVNPVDDREKLDKERAVNQSNWEQGLRMLGQIGNEITVGTALGFADLADAIYNAVNNRINDENNDYQSELSNSIEELKNSINERLAIYRENPNKAWDVSDFAWWASNAPSIASSLTLMLPGQAVAKGVSFAGKAVRFNKIANKIANASNMSQKTRAIIGKIADSSSIGITSRYLENYQEARQTYKDVEDYSINQLASMNNKQREEFYNNNPQYKDKSDEEIAKDIAKNSADVTFNEDWANVFFDIWQVYSLKNLWKDALAGTTNSSGLRRFNDIFNSNIDDAAAITNAVSNKTTKQAITSTLKDVGNDIVHGVRAEWTEGVEEAINYIASQDGMYNAKKVFDKDTDVATLKDYLKDPLLWEQAFWGALGGITFSGVMNKASSFINKKFNKDWVSAEKQKENEILGRTATFQAYQERLKTIAEGKNPFITVTDNNGQQVNPDLVIGTEEEVRAIAEKEYMDNIITNAINAGNLNLLKDSVNSVEFNKSIREKLGIDEQRGNELIERFKTEINNIEKTYNTVINKVNRLGGNFEIGRIIATQFIHANNRKNNYDNLLNWAQSELDSAIDNNNIQSADINSAKNGIYKYISDTIKNDIQQIQNNASIAENIKNERIKQLNDKLAAINELYLEIDEFTANNDINNAINLQKQYNEVFKALSEVVNAEINVNINNQQLNYSDNNLKDKITYYNNFFNESRRKIVNNAMDDLREAYKKYGKKYVNNVISDINNGNNPKEDKIIRNAYAALELDSKGNEHLRNTIEQLAEIAELENNIRNNPSEENQAPENPDTNNNNIEEESNASSEPQSPSPTGGESIQINPDENKSANVPVNPPATQQIETPENTEEPEKPISSPNENTKPVLPDDEFERGRIGMDLVYEAIAELEEKLNIPVATSSELNASRQNFIDTLIDNGFEKEEATDIVNNIISGLTGEVLFSSVNDDTNRKLVLNAAYATITGNEKNIESVLDDFANSIDSEGNTRGKTVNGVVYVSIGQLVDYLDSITGNKIIKNYLFNQIKSYIYSSTNSKGKYRATDNSTIKRLNDKQFVQYVDDIAKSRLERLRAENTNNVNISYIVDENSAKEFINTKLGDELEFSNDEKNGRINISNNGVLLGYIGIPNIDSNGNYNRINEGWIYNIHAENGRVISPLKDALISILDGDRFDEEFIGHLYELAVKDEVTQQELNDLYKELKTKYPDIITNFISSNNSSVVTQHLIKLTKYIFRQPYGNSHEASINLWFNNLLNSYDQAITIAKGDFKGKIKVSNIKYGVLNTIDENNTEWNDIENTVENYNEETNKLGVVVQNKVYLNGESSPVIIENLTSNGMAVISVPNGDGTSLYAFCKQVSTNSNLLKGNAKNIVNAIKTEVHNICTEFINGNISFSELSDRLGDIFGNNKIINGDANGLKMIITPTSIGFYVKSASFNGKPYAFTINADTAKFKRNIIINNPDITKDNQFKIGKSFGVTSNTVGNIGNYLNDVIDEMFKYAQFAVSKDFISDNNITNNKQNRYLYRENNKTVLNINGETYTYNSYQDFIVKNGLVRTKLAKSNTANSAGNWAITDISKLEIRYELEGNPPVEDGAIPEIISDFMLDTTLDAITQPDFVEALNSKVLTTGLKRYFANDKESLDYINSLQKLGIIPKNVKVSDKITDNKGNPVNAVYHTETDTIEISSDALYGQRVYRAVNIILHESLHRKLYKNYDKKQVADKVRPIYDKFKSWLEQQDDAVKKELSPYLFENFSEDVALEEFMVESLTSNKLMTALNNIMDEDRKASKISNLFTRLLKAIADMLGIKINEDSLLATARDAYSSITELNNKSNTNESVAQIADNNISSEQVKNPNEDSSNNYDYSNDNALNDGMDIFSSISDMTSRNMSELVSQIPYQQQAQFANLLDTGHISFVCM